LDDLGVEIIGPEQSIRLEGYLQNHPAMDRIYRFKQRLSYLLLKKHRTRKQCEQLIPRLRHSREVSYLCFPKLTQAV
jgi:hypothetical protein